MCNWVRQKVRLNFTCVLESVNVFNQMRIPKEKKKVELFICSVRNKKKNVHPQKTDYSPSIRAIWRYFVFVAARSLFCLNPFSMPVKP